MPDFWKARKTRAEYNAEDEAIRDARIAEKRSQTLGFMPLSGIPIRYTANGWAHTEGISYGPMVREFEDEAFEGVDLAIYPSLADAEDSHGRTPKDKLG